MLRLQAISKSFDEHSALRDIDLDVPAGGTTVLIGPSGCGKSTLLRLVIGLAAPDSGRLLIDDHELHPDTILAARRRLGYVIQDGGLFPHLTARGNVTLAAETFGWAADRITSRIETLRELTHMPADTLARYPVQLSGGQDRYHATPRTHRADRAWRYHSHECF